MSSLEIIVVKPAFDSIKYQIYIMCEWIVIISCYIKMYVCTNKTEELFDGDISDDNYY